MTKYNLTEYEVKEISLVKEGAVQEKFLILKRGNNKMPSLLEKIQAIEIPAEEIEKLAKKYNLTPEQAEALKAHMAISKADNADGILKAFDEARGIVKKDVDPGKSGDGEDDGEDENNAGAAEDQKKADVEKAVKEKEEAEKKLEKLEKENLRKEFVEKAKAYTHSGVEAGKLADLLIEVSKGLKKETLDKVLSIFKAYEGALEKSDIFKENGSDGEGSSDAEAEVEKLAKSRAAEKKITYEKAYTEIIKENPELYDKLENEKE